MTSKVRTPIRRCSRRDLQRPSDGPPGQHHRDVHKLQCRARPAHLRALTPPIAVEGAAILSAALFQFSSGNSAATAAEFTATIVWGDGTTSTVTAAPGAAGEIVAVPSGGFDVFGSHTYPEELSGVTFSVTVTQGAATTVAQDTHFSVADAPLIAVSITPPVATVGQVLTNLLLFHFTDADPAGTASDYTATISWGDGTTSTVTATATAAGRIAADPSGGFDVYGSHTYVKVGTTFSVQVTDHPATTGLSQTFTVAQGTPVVAVADASGTYNGKPFTAKAMVAGAVAGVDTTPAGNLESVSPTCTYYVGTSARRAGSATAPTNAGTYTVVAAFPGSTSYTSAESSPVTFTIAQSATTVTIATSANPSVFSQAAITAIVKPVVPGAGTPTGTVNFFDATTQTDLGSYLLSGGKATLGVSALNVGSHTISASDQGDPNFLPSASGSLVQTVNKAQTAITLAFPVSVSSGGSVFGQAVTITATVSAASPSTATPDGNVTFEEAGQPLAGQSTVTLDNRGQAAFTTSALSAGLHTITVVYAGSSHFAVGTSQQVPSIVTIAGSGSWSGDNGPATNAELYYPGSVAVDTSGDLFIADTGNDRIREVLSTGPDAGQIITVAGDGTQGYSGDNGPATSANSTSPAGWQWTLRETCSSPTPGTTGYARFWPVVPTRARSLLWPATARGDTSATTCPPRAPKSSSPIAWQWTPRETCSSPPGTR